MRLLLIDDDAEIAESLNLHLKEAGHSLDVAEDGDQGCFLALLNKYDLLICDYVLPKLNGRQVVEKIRQSGSSLPIIMLTVKTELGDKVDLLQLGADDYLAKPFAFSELLARIQAIARRPESLRPKRFQLGNLELDASGCSARRNGSMLSLAAKEFSLLQYLMENQKRVVSRQEIMDNVWDENADPFSNTIEVHIMRLRQKLEKHGPRLIFTIPSRGYKIDEPLSV